MTTCSVIVPTYNRAPLLARLLRALEAQDIGTGAFEVVVCDDGSSDPTRAILEQSRPYTLTALHRENGGPAAARNDAIRAARGHILVFLDDDVEPAPQALRLHIEAHEHQPNLVVLGAMLAHEGVRTPWIAWELRTLARQYDAMTRGLYEPTARQFFTANASVRREHVIAAGMFDPAYRRAEDVELAYRMQDRGVRFAFRPGIRVWHDPDRTLTSWRRIARQYGEADVEMWRKGREHILRVTSIEYGERSRLVRTVSRTLVGRPRALAAASSAAMAGARFAWALGARRVPLGLCSLVFNLEHYQGVATALGGRAAFWDAIDHPSPEPEARPAREPRLAALKSDGGR